MNPVIIPTLNCCLLTMKCIDSVMNQDIPVDILVVDNGSTDENLLAYLRAMNGYEDGQRSFEAIFFGENRGVSKAWNVGLASYFNTGLADHALVLNNDLEVPPQFYRLLLEQNELFITGVNVGTPNGDPYWKHREPNPEMAYKSPHPDFSAFLIRRQCWELVGSFDENMVLYAQDCDYHVRMHQNRVWAGSINVEYYHYASGTVKQASDESMNSIVRQADLDRDEFKKKYGCEIGKPEYDRLFTETPNATILEHVR